MNTGTHDFRDIRPMPAFIDKTMLIEKIMREKYSRVRLIAPRRFGKSVNLSMLKRFLERKYQTRGAFFFYKARIFTLPIYDRFV